MDKIIYRAMDVAASIARLSWFDAGVTAALMIAGYLGIMFFAIAMMHS